LAARASGISIDARTDHPSGIYHYYPIYNLTMDKGDTFSRAYMRYIEIKQSINFIKEQLENFPDNYPVDNKQLSPLAAKDSLVVSITEGWRGEIVHTMLTNNKGNILRYKIKDPSFNNWLGLALAVRDNGISDFPLCNKSFNLSYCGFDL
jgi:Ni,Fe-hydrogenase III large subunit